MRVRSANASRAAGSTLGSRRPAGGAELGELPGGVPVQRSLVLQRLGEVPEHRQRREEVVRPPLGRGVVGHASEPTGSSWAAALGVAPVCAQPDEASASSSVAASAPVLLISGAIPSCAGAVGSVGSAGSARGFSAGPALVSSRPGGALTWPRPPCRPCGRLPCAGRWCRPGCSCRSGARLLPAVLGRVRGVGDLGRPLLRHALVLERLVLLLVLHVGRLAGHRTTSWIVRSSPTRAWRRAVSAAPRRPRAQSQSRRLKLR